MKTIKVTFIILMLATIGGCASSSTLDDHSKLTSHVYSFNYKKIFFAAQESALALGWQIIGSNYKTGIIYAKSSAKFLTSGQNISILVHDLAGKKTKVDISSGNTSQIIDWGQSYNDIEQFYLKLDQHLN